MQRRIVLIRHGHADDGASDFDRQLSVAGREAATRTGRVLARGGLLPERVLASAAPRALVTAELAARAAGYDGHIQSEQALYLAAEATYLAALRRLPTQTSSVWLVGHNPGLSVLARDLCGHASALAPAEHASVQLELDDWAEL